jgi:hypothetical protein
LRRILESRSRSATNDSIADRLNRKAPAESQIAGSNGALRVE